MRHCCRWPSSLLRMADGGSARTTELGALSQSRPTDHRLGKVELSPAANDPLPFAPPLAGLEFKKVLVVDEHGDAHIGLTDACDVTAELDRPIPMHSGASRSTSTRNQRRWGRDEARLAKPGAARFCRRLGQPRPRPELRLDARPGGAAVSARRRRFRTAQTISPAAESRFMPPSFFRSAWSAAASSAASPPVQSEYRSRAVVASSAASSILLLAAMIASDNRQSSNALIPIDGDRPKTRTQPHFATAFGRRFGGPAAARGVLRPPLALTGRQRATPGSISN